MELEEASTIMHLEVNGMTCNHCAKTVEGIIAKEGGTDIHIDYLMGEASFDPKQKIDVERLLSKLKSAGYESKSTSEVQFDGIQWSDIEKKFFFTLPFSLLLLSHMFTPHHWLVNDMWFQFFICLPVFCLGLWHFGKSSYLGIVNKNLSMDLLILIGSSSAFFYSLYGLLTFGNEPQGHSFMFFETTSTIITLVLFGYVIEHKAVQKTTTVLKELIKSKPEKAKKLVQKGLNQEIEVVKASELKAEETILINAGDRVPADGTIIYGALTLDEAMLTGESTPLTKTSGERLFAGSIITDGNGTMKVERAGADSTIGQILQLIKESRADKPAIQRLADQISQWFVPAILLIALAAFFTNMLWLEVSVPESLLRAVAVLVIACPCAMGLATPTAVSVGLSLAGRLGIIVKKASSFETLNKISHLVFDKTGTLTKGNLETHLLNLSEQHNISEVWSNIKALETRSSHPISKSFLKATKGILSAELTNIEEIKGQGIIGWNGNTEHKIGSRSFTKITDKEGDLFYTINGSFVASFKLSDELKGDVKEVISWLNNRGFQTSILSGDSLTKTRETAEALAIPSFEGQKLPEEKLAYINDLKTKNNVAMIGDGINDAPSLAAANLGISTGTANALAAESADIALLGNQLKQLQWLVTISQKVVSTIKQNLFWAFAYNIVAIPLAVLGYLDPMIAALSMAFSDLVVIGNSLRLQLILPKTIR